MPSVACARSRSPPRRCGGRSRGREPASRARIAPRCSRRAWVPSRPIPRSPEARNSFTSGPASRTRSCAGCDAGNTASSARSTCTGSPWPRQSRRCDSSSSTRSTRTFGVCASCTARGCAPDSGDRCSSPPSMPCCGARGRCWRTYPRGRPTAAPARCTYSSCPEPVLGSFACRVGGSVYELAQHGGGEAAARQVKAHQHGMRLRRAIELRDAQSQAPPLMRHARRCAQRARGGELRADALLECQYARSAPGRAAPPQGAAGMDLQTRRARGERRIVRVHREEAAASVEHGEIPGTGMLPAAVLDPCAEHRVEYHAACRREHEAALGGRQAQRLAAGDALEIRAVPAEALWTEVVGYATRGDDGETRREAAREAGAVALARAQPDGEAVAGKRSARELALVRMHLEHLEALPGPSGEPGATARLGYGKPLDGDGAAVLQPGVAHIARMAAG